MPSLEMASEREVIAHDNPKRQHKRPQFGRQLLGTAGLVNGRASDRNCLCMAIRLVTRVRGRFGWFQPQCPNSQCPKKAPLGRASRSRTCEPRSVGGLVSLVHAVGAIWLDPR